MASVNVGQLSARFGLDPREFIDKLRGISGATELMSNQMKRDFMQASREGGESLRLIDESLGIHLSRPLVRILTQEFPSFAKGLQTVLGGAVFGALATVGVEAFDKVERSIEKAQKAEEELVKSSENVTAVFTTEINSYKEKDKAVTAATEAVRKLMLAQEAETKAMLEAAGPMNQVLAAIGNFAHNTFSFESTLNLEAVNREMTEFNKNLAIAQATDALKGTNESAKLLDAEIVKLNDHTIALANAMGTAAAAPPATVPLVVGRGVIQYSGAKAGPTSDELDLAQLQMAQARQTAAVWKTILDAEHGKEAGAQMEEATRAFAALQNDIAGGMAKLAPESDPIKKLRTDITGLEMQAENDFRKLKESAASALELRAAESRLAEYKKHLEDVFNIARRNADVAKATAELPSKVAAGPAPVISAGTGSAALGAGGLAGEQLDAFAKDTVAQLSLIAHAQESGITMLQKYGIEMAKLEIAFQGRDDAASQATKQAAENALINEYSIAAVKAASATEKLQEQMQKLLEKSTDAGAGMKAFLIQLQINASENAKFVYDEMTAASTGASSSAAESLIKIIEVHKNQHQQLIHELRAMWENYFGGLARMAVEHGLQKLLAPAAGGIEKLLHIGPIGKDAALDANTAALHSVTAALLQKGGGAGLLGLIPGGGAAGGGGGWSGGGAAGTQAGGDVPFFAEGGDVSPGGSFIFAEAGAERVDLKRGGGAHVTPLGGTVGGDTHVHNNYDLRGAVVTDDLMRKADAAAMMEHTRSAAVAGAVSVSREASLRARPQR